MPLIVEKCFCALALGLAFPWQEITSEPHNQSIHNAADPALGLSNLNELRSRLCGV